MNDLKETVSDLQNEQEEGIIACMVLNNTAKEIEI